MTGSNGVPDSATRGELRVWRFGGRSYQLGAFPLLMGIVNVTPDSFSDGGEFLDADAATHHALELVDAGADLLDIGGESTRPGAAPVPLEEELRRVIPVVRKIASKVTVPISIDTYKSEVARRALDAGATVVNDVSGLTFDAQMPSVCHEHNAGVILMHMQGTPQTMQDAPRYRNVIAEICEFFSKRLGQLEQEGIVRECVVLDPGIGFGKTAEHNLTILSNVRTFRELGRPLLIGHSRKRFLAALLGRSLNEGIFGTVGITLALALQSTDIIRVHDVAANRNALLAWKSVVEHLGPQNP